jgi:GTPase SAR1 family protein
VVERGWRAVRGAGCGRAGRGGGLTGRRGVQADAEALMQLADSSPVTEEVATMVKRVWEDEGIQRTYQQRSTFQLADSTAYFMTTRLDDVGKADYLPSDEDMLRVRMKTSGVHEMTIDVHGTKFLLVDVGGQRNERRKWIHCFSEVTAVIFVAAASEYDQTMLEEATKNRLIDALALFDEIANAEWFSNKDIILFLNKVDLFREKIARVDIRQELPDGTILFGDYRGGCNFDDGIQYILDKFLERNENPNKTIYFKQTTATDRSNVEHVFRSCQDIILKDNLIRGGFMEEEETT